FMVLAPLSFSTLSLHDALPIYFSEKSSGRDEGMSHLGAVRVCDWHWGRFLRRLRLLLGFERPSFRGGLAFASRFWSRRTRRRGRSEEHTSELQSRGHLVCRLLL